MKLQTLSLLLMAATALTAAEAGGFRVEQGLRGSAQRKTARAFNGELEPGAGPAAPRLGSPSDPVDAAAAPSDVVEVTASRFARFDEAAHEAAAQPLFARGRTGSGKGAATVSANTPAAFDPRSRFTTHSDGDIVEPQTTFEWTRDRDWVWNNWLWIGSCQDCTDILDEEQGSATSRTIRMPVDGRRIYVTLFSNIGGDWYWIDYQFTASSGEPARAAAMLTPAAGSTLSVSQTFTWNPGSRVEQMYLRIGTCAGCKDILDEDQGLHTSRSVRIPAEGKVIWVRLFSRFGGDWYYYEYQYRQPSNDGTSVRVNVTNKLAWEIRISVNGRVMGGVPAYETRGLDVSVDTLKLSFEVIQPTLSGRSLGDPMSGVFSEIARPSGTYNFTVNNKIGSTYFFAPIITNKTAVTGLLEVNGGLASQNRCNCTIPANTNRVGTGYYKWYSNSNVRVYRSGSNYTGSYRYWDGDTLQRTVAADSGVAELTLTVAP